VLGGLGLLLHGMELAGANLQLASGRAMRRLLGSLADHRWRAAGAGALTAFLVNSSAVTAVVVVGLAGAGLLAAAPAMAAMAGAGLGSALMVLLLAFRAGETWAFLAAAGAALAILGRGERMRVWSRLLLAASLVLLGMALLTAGLASAGHSRILHLLLARSQGPFPLPAFLFGVAMTVATGSSSATVAFLMALAQALDRSGTALSLTPLCGAVLGANLGTCVTPWVASGRSGATARRVAGAYLLYKLLLAACLLPLAGPFGILVQILTRQVTELTTGVISLLRPDAARLTANLHLAMNLLGVLAAVPLADRLTRLAERWIPSARDGEEAPRLPEEALKTPELALAQARHEVLRLADAVRVMLEGGLEALRRGSSGFNRDLAAKDVQVDRLQRAVTDYLSRLLGLSPTRQAAANAVALIAASDDLESMGDMVVRDLIRLADKKSLGALEFSAEGWQELEGFHAGVLGLLAATREAILAEDPRLHEACLVRAKHLLAEEGALRLRHIERLTKGVAVSQESSRVHLDVLHAFRQAAEHLADLNRAARGTADASATIPA